MKTDNIERYLESFGKQVVNRAKGNLQKMKGGGTALELSIRFEVIPDNEGFSVEFWMGSYGTYVDKGVSGNKKSRKFKDYKNKTISTPYKYGSKQPPPDILAKWISKKGIKGRDKKTGKYISNMSLAFIIGRKIKRDGIQGISFFQKPLGLGLKQFGKHLLQNVKEDIMSNLQKETKSTVK
tara:strand:+ start:141 stop:683 length:543 start_codon:yes stop_codon:yes gene_type:complete